MSKRFNVEVAYAEPEKQLIKSLEIETGATAIEAVRQSGILEEFAGLQDSDELELGIFGKKCQHGEVLQTGDRVEIYRPLLVDPKEARRLKAETQEKRRKNLSG